jgi:Tfp pilus assembly protein PilN
VNPVNLLPAKHRPRTPTGGQQGSAYIVVGILGALLVMVVFYVLTVNSVNSRKNQVAHAKADTGRAQARASSLTSYGDFSKIKDQRVQSVKQLAGGRIDWERLTRGLARVLPNEVWLTSASASASGTPAAAGTSGGAAAASSAAGAGTFTGPKVELVGCAPTHAVVAVTLVRLRELSGAQDVQLNEITRPEPTTGGGSSSTSGPASSSGGGGGCGLVHGQPAAKWDATVSFNQNPGSSTAGVPKSLGGGA